MATKTITIDLEAYQRLKRITRRDDSQAIKRVVPMPFDVKAWIKSMEADPFSEDFVAAVEEQIANRARPSKRGRVIACSRFSLRWRAGVSSNPPPPGSP